MRIASQMDYQLYGMGEIMHVAIDPPLFMFQRIGTYEVLVGRITDHVIPARWLSLQYNDYLDVNCLSFIPMYKDHRFDDFNKWLHRWEGMVVEEHRYTHTVLSRYIIALGCSVTDLEEASVLQYSQNKEEANFGLEFLGEYGVYTSIESTGQIVELRVLDLDKVRISDYYQEITYAETKRSK